MKACKGTPMVSSAMLATPTPTALACSGVPHTTEGSAASTARPSSNSWHLNTDIVTLFTMV